MKDIRIADIIPNGSYLRSNADIPMLYEMAILKRGEKICIKKKSSIMR